MRSVYCLTGGAHGDPICWLLLDGEEISYVLVTSDSRTAMMVIEMWRHPSLYECIPRVVKESLVTMPSGMTPDELLSYWRGEWAKTLKLKEVKP